MALIIFLKQHTNNSVFRSKRENLKVLIIVWANKDGSLTYDSLNTLKSSLTFFIPFKFNILLKQLIYRFHDFNIVRNEPMDKIGLT